MSIHRVDKSKGNFTSVSNQMLKDKRLSLNARVLLTLMLSLPDNWSYTIAGMASLSGEGEYAVKTAVLNHEKNGYLVRQRTRSSDGRMGKSEWDIYEEPITVKSDRASNDAPKLRKPTLDNPTAVSPTVEKQPLQIKEEQRKDQINMIDAIDRARIWREQIKFNIESEELIDRFGKDRVNQIIDLITDAIISEAPLPLSKKSKISWEHVVERFRRLEPEHIAYVLESIKEKSQSGISIPIC